MVKAPEYMNPPLAPEDAPPKGYKWDPSHPGTLKPGTVPDNYPLEDVMASGVVDNMVFVELDTDERYDQIYKPDEDLFVWLQRIGRLLPRDGELEDDPDAKTERDPEISGITEEDLDYTGDDGRMIAYYSKDNPSISSGYDFGGFSDAPVEFDNSY